MEKRIRPPHGKRARSPLVPSDGNAVRRPLRCSVQSRWDSARHELLSPGWCGAATVVPSKRQRRVLKQFPLLRLVLTRPHEGELQLLRLVKVLGVVVVVVVAAAASSSSSSSSSSSRCCCWCVLTQTLLLQAFEADDESLTLDQLLQAARAAPPPKPPPEPAPATPPPRPTRTVSGERARLCYEASRAANNSVGVGGASPSCGGSDALGLALDPRTLGPQDRVTVRSSGASPASTVGGSSHSSKC